MSYLIRRVLAKQRLILDEMCRLYGKFTSYLRRVLCKTRLIFPRINGPNVCYLDMSAFQDRLDQPKGAFDRLCTPEGEYKVRSFQISSSVKIWGLNSKTRLYTLQYCLRRFYKCCCTLCMPG